MLLAGLVILVAVKTVSDVWHWRNDAAAEDLVSDFTFTPEHLAEMARFTLATGLRKANVVGLEWSQVDLERECAWIHPDQAKARKAIPVPLNADAMAVIRRQAKSTR